MHHAIVRATCASLLALLPPAEARDASPSPLERIYGGMAIGCAYDQDAQLALLRSYVDEGGARPRLARPDGGRRIAPQFGRARFADAGESYTLTIRVQGGSLYGLPVRSLAPYRGVHTDIAGVAITFAAPLPEVRRQLGARGIRFTARETGFGTVAPRLEAAADGRGSVLSCDLSM